MRTSTGAILRRGAGCVVLVLAQILTVACDSRPVSPAEATAPRWRDEPPSPPPPPARFADPAAGRYHMRRHFDDLRIIEQLLIAGRLAEGTALAYLLVRRLDDPGLASWSDRDQRVADAAQALVEAPSLDEALRREVRVMAECAGCHATAQVAPKLRPAPAVPVDDGGRPARMARHVWAVDRLWEGLVAPSDERWTRGLDVLAQTPMPFAPRSDAPLLGARLQDVARRQLAGRAVTDLDDRAAAYGELLVTCTACHASLRVTLR